MATCGSLSLWCALYILAACTSFGKSQVNGGFQQTPKPDNCTAFNASNPCQSPGLEQKIYCLANGTSVTGFCEAQQEICGNNGQLHRDPSFCSSSIKESTTISRTSAKSEKTTPGSFPINQKIGRKDDHGHDHEDGHDHKDHDDNAASLLLTSCHMILLCSFIAVTYAPSLLGLL